MTEGFMVGWHHRLKGHESEQAQGDGEGQGSLEWLLSMGLKRATVIFAIFSLNKNLFQKVKMKTINVLNLDNNNTSLNAEEPIFTTSSF